MSDPISISSESTRETKTHFLTLLIQKIAFVILLLGTVVSLGWFLGLKNIVSLRPDFPPMQLTTALMFVLSGISLLAFQRNYLRLSVTLNGLIFAVGSWILWGNSHRGGIGGEKWISFLPKIPETFVGYPSTPTLLCFVASSVSLIILSLRKESFASRFITGIGIGFTMALSSLSVVGYLTGLIGASIWSFFSGMAAHTAFGLFCLSIALWILWRRDYSERKLKRSPWVLIPIGVFCLTVVILFWRTLILEQQTNVVQKTELIAKQIKDEIVFKLDSRVLAFNRIAYRWTVRGGTPLPELEADVSHYLKDEKVFKAFEWADSSYHIRWVYPRDENAMLLGFDLSQDFRWNAFESLKRAEREKLNIFSPIISLKQGGRGFLLYAPLSTPKKFDGFMVGVFGIDEFFKSIFSHVESQGYNLQIEGDEGIIYSTPHLKSEEENYGAETEINEGPFHWKLRVHPTPILLTQRLNNIPYLILGFGLAVVVLLLGFIRAIQRFRDHADLNEEINFKLSREISETLETKEKLKESLQLQNAILSSTSYLIVSTDAQGTVTSFNEAAQKALGYTRAEVVNKWTPALWHDEEEVVRRAEILSKELGEKIEPGFDVFTVKLKRFGVSEDTEWTFIRRDGTRFPGVLSVAAIRNHQGITGYLGVVADITERKEAERKNQRLRNTMNAHSIVAITDVAGTILEANDGFCRISQYFREELVGQNHRLINSGFHPREFFREMYHTISSGKTWQGEIKNRAKDGTYYWVSSTIVPWMNDEGKPEYYVAFRTDITQQKLLQEELTVAKEQAEEASRAKSEFLAMMSHEIRTPMNGIIGFSSLLDQMSLEETQREYVSIIQTCGQNLLSLINDILDFSKMEARKLELVVQEFDLNEAIHYVRELLTPKAEEKGIEIVHFVDPRVTLLYRGDQQRIQQILMNLVGNAVKFTEKGEISIITQHEAASEVAPASIKVKVKDSGVGIPEGRLKELFTPFTQVDSSSTRKFEGTGLGLAISMGLVKMMGGEIGCQSVYGKGSEFWFTLPILNLKKERVESPPQDESLDLSILHGLKILIIDTIETDRILFKEQLTHWKTDCDVASSAEEGHSKLKKAAQEGAPFTIAVIDCQMDDEKALHLAKMIREDLALTQMLLIGLSSVPFAKGSAFTEIGFNTVLIKPIMKQEHFLAEVLKALQMTNPPEQPSPAPSHLEKPISKRASLRFLVAEDNDLNWRLIGLQLMRWKAELVWAKNGKEACEKVMEGAFDLVLMDCQMPEMDGYEATAKIREMEREGRISTPSGHDRLPILAVTAHAFDSNREKCLSVGMDDILTKPISTKDLDQILQKWLNQEKKA
ncbi:MAG: PAS domain S-box protein [Verrucomicrobiota bacterium]